MLEDNLINYRCTLNDALNKIEINKKGVVFLVNDERKLLGSITDGDIRRHLLKQHETTIELLNIANTSPAFIYASTKNQTQQLLDKLSSGFKSVPIIDKDNVVLEVVSEQKVEAVTPAKAIYSRVPLRCSLSGGGTDLYAFYKSGAGQTISLTTKKFVYCQIVKHPKHEVLIEVLDLNETIVVANGDYTSALEENKTNLALITLSQLNLAPGHKLTIWSDVPVGSGLGGSTAMVTAIIYAFDRYNGIDRNRNNSAELAFSIERVYAGLSGGWQDQFALSFGGANLINYSEDGHQVLPLNLSSQTISFLESSLFLVNTKHYHNSSQIQSTLINSLENSGDEHLIEMKHTTEKILECLINGPLSELGDILNMAWETKKQSNEKISNGTLNHIYDTLISSGAAGAKLLGAGGGGYFLTFVMPQNTKRFIELIDDEGLSAERFLFCPTGAETWII